MQGHAAANMVPVIAANRIGTEVGKSCTVTFYGGSFATDATGALLDSLGCEDEGLVLAQYDLDRLATMRAAWGLFRDRRPDLYVPLLTLDGQEG